MRKNKNSGFSLVELIIVIAIIGIIAVILTGSYLSYIDKAKRANAENAATDLFGAVRVAFVGGDSHERSEIVKWLNSSGSGLEVRYVGPNDNSVTLVNTGSYHDHAKIAIRKLAGGEVFPFGYRMRFAFEYGDYVLKEMEIFYKKPGNAGINAKTGDFIIS